MTVAQHNSADDTSAVSPKQQPKRVQAALIVNPYSSGMTARRERAIVALLREDFDVHVRRTERAGHAIQLASEACSNGAEVIIACGGDGTGNEVLQGMNIDEGTAENRPRFALIPAGGTNVLCRALGLPNDPVRATRQIAAAIGSGSTRTINLGRMDERIFMFAAGVGLDGELIKRMEQRRSGRRPSDIAHVSTLVGIFAAEKFALNDRCSIQVEGSDETIRGCLVMICNTTPFTYMGRIPMHFMPEASLDKGLDFMAPHRANALLAMRNSAQAMGLGRKRRRLASPEAVQQHHDVERFTVTCDDPTPCQADGEYLGDRTKIEFSVAHDAVRIVI